MALAVGRVDLPMSLVFGKSYERLGAHSAPGESCHVCSRSLAPALSAERLRKSCKPQLDASRVACLRPHADQALLAFAARFWCPEVELLNLLSQALKERTGVLPALLCRRAGWPAGLPPGPGDSGTSQDSLVGAEAKRRERCPAVSQGRGHGRAAVAAAGERLPRSLTPTRRHRRAHADRCRFVPA